MTTTYTRNGASTTITANPITVTVASQTATPEFTEYGDMCLGTSRTFAVAPVPGATSYTWTLPANFVGPTTVTTTEPRLLATAPTTGGCNFCFVQVAANANGCPAGVASAPLNYGGMSVRISTPYGLPSEVCRDTEVTYEANVSDRPNLPNLPQLVYTWTVDGVIVAQGPTEARISVLSPPPGQQTSIRVDVEDGGCSRSTFDAVGLQSVSRLSSGEYCAEFSMYRQSTSLAYPNPADATVTLEQAPGATITIFNSQGQPMYEGKANKEAVRIDTRAWPAGLYFVQRRQGNTIERQQLQIKH
ncbi:T9SS type A sorting domain-containing protein [Hymenobacter amundsenii]|uniref:T9SS type A sorting domain-containing protein n=1 Tax=Hymenobacter amundsenii TaxID=2006685 RepID=UPI0013FE1C9F|nr:T9SS type A sorting domain-containing protein [Hymenobacter amundsenii]